MNKKIYSPPIARDLSCIRGSGGLLSNGTGSLLGMCANGPSVTGANCTEGTRVDGTGSCEPFGFQVEGNYCSGGNGGSSGCVSGTYAST